MTNDEIQMKNEVRNPNVEVRCAKRKLSSFRLRHSSFCCHSGFVILACLGMQLMNLPAFSCEIPVFRYALERWAPDPYQVLIIHPAPLTADQQELVKNLQRAAADPAKPANLEVIAVNLSEPSDDPTMKLMRERYEALSAPLLALRQPNSLPDAKPIWTAELTAENIERVVDSPARREIVSRLIAGQSAVWVMLETGDTAKDDAAAASIEKELASLAKELKLPEKDVLEGDEFFKPETKVPLKIEFSLLRLKPGDAKEEAFRAMLLNSEADLIDRADPIVMPVFGRGRTCFVLVGKGINPQQMADNSRFITGRCSCQVKYDNPGVDLLLAADWDKLVGGRTDLSKPLPELSGLGVLVVDVEPAKLPKKLGQNLVNPALPATPTTSPVVEGTGAAAGSPVTTTDPKVEADEAEVEAKESKELADARPLPEKVDGPHISVEGSRPMSIAPLVVGVGIVVGVGVLLAVLGSLWVKSKGTGS